MLENITFSYFAEQVVSHPALLIAVLLTLSNSGKWMDGCTKCHSDVCVYQMYRCG